MFRVAFPIDFVKCVHQAGGFLTYAWGNQNQNGHQKKKILLLSVNRRVLLGAGGEKISSAAKMCFACPKGEEQQIWKFLSEICHVGKFQVGGKKICRRDLEISDYFGQSFKCAIAMRARPKILIESLPHYGRTKQALKSDSFCLRPMMHLEGNAQTH